MSAKWSDVPEDIKDTFETSGNPAGRAGNHWPVWAPSMTRSLVYHNVRAEVAAQGVVYTDMESAMHWSNMRK